MTGDAVVVRHAEVLEDGDIIISGGQLTAGPTEVDADGIRVGDNVELDAEGLHIGGILQPAIESLRGEDAANNESLTTSFTTVNQVVLTIPSFATVVDVVAWARIQVLNTSGSGYDVINQVVLDVDGQDDAASARHTTPDNQTQSVQVQRSARITSPGSTITVNQNVRLSAGSNSSNQSRLSVFAIARRVA